jgi:hypothetical protein
LHPLIKIDVKLLLLGCFLEAGHEVSELCVLKSILFKIHFHSFLEDVFTHEDSDLSDEASSFTIADFVEDVCCIVGVVDGDLDWMGGL